MKALILAAGYGTRLYAIIKDKPKALLEINGKALVDYILDRIEKIPDLNEVILVTNNKFNDQFIEWAKAKEGVFPHKITIVNDGTETPEDRLGSIGDIDFVLKNTAVNDDLMILGGDNLFDYDIAAYTEFAKQKTDAVSIGLYDIHDLEEAKLFGVVAIDENRKVTSFEEKPAEPKSSLIAMCFYYLPKVTLSSVGDYLKEVKKSDTAGDYIRWICEKKDVYGFTFEGTWYDIGSVESYHEAQEKFKN